MKQGEREVSLAGAEGGCFQQSGLRGSSEWKLEGGE